jgi:hypothetical protein
MHHRGSRAALAMVSANIVFSCDLLNSLSCLPTVLRDIFFATGGHRRLTTPAFASAPALSWVLLLAACDHVSGPNELAWR